MLDFNAVVVAGGKSSRLGGTPKAGLSNGSQTLLDTTLKAVADARICVVVGPDDLPLPDRVLQTVEEPRFSGPAAAIAAGMLVLPQDAAPWTLVFSVDMPEAHLACKTLLPHAEQADDQQGFMGMTDGVLQPLAGIYRTQDLIAISHQETANKSVRRWLGQLNYQLVELPSGSTQDVDTWEQAQASGYTHPTW